MISFVERNTLAALWRRGQRRPVYRQRGRGGGVNWVGDSGHQEALTDLREK